MAAIRQHEHLSVNASADYTHEHRKDREGGNMRAALIIASSSAFAASLFVTTPSIADSNTNPWVGTWSLDPSHSKYSPGPPHKSATIIVTDTGNGKLTFVTDITDGAGEKDHSEFTCTLDKTECPVITGGAKETVSIENVGTRSLKLHWKFNDPPPFFVDMLIKMSEDKQTQVAISKGKLPDGTALAVTEVWHKT
jgi:hypothetical protein